MKFLYSATFSFLALQMSPLSMHEFLKHFYLENIDSVNYASPLDVDTLHHIITKMKVTFVNITINPIRKVF